jgi:hypothetical protein
MNNARRMATVVITLLFVSQAYGQATVTTGVFDTVTTLEIGRTYVTIRGIEKDTGGPVIASFENNVQIDRCVPLFMTAFEKPGRYFLYVSYGKDSPSQTSGASLFYCRLDLKP